MNENSEARLVEQPTIELFAELGYETVNAYKEIDGVNILGRETHSDVVLVPRLRAALQRLNPTLSAEALDLAIEDLTRPRNVLSLVNANRQVYRLLKDGVGVHVRDAYGGETVEVVRVIDWETPTNNDFLLVSQLWVTGQVHTRRPDVVGFVNGIPLVLCEFKASHRPVEDAFNDNVTDYKDTIPQLFWYNAMIILSNGSKSLVGSLTAGLEHFFEWKKVESEGEEGVVSLETMIRGTCDKRRLLDIVENFTLFSDASGDLRKIIAKNHQYLGVNSALEAVYAIRENQGRLGVFWHTQGSGKSFSMIFFAQKVLRKVTGNWTFVIVTDRDDLDNQIYKTFASVGAVTEAEEEVRAEDGEHLKQLLRADHRTVFTLIQKFRIERGGTYPELSRRLDIIVMTDEAHRSQYDTLARNMRNALPNAAFIGFTGTPLMKGGEEETRAVFGDYVSIYNFRQSVEDGTTVPLYYENRIPELQLKNPEINEEMERIIESAGLDEQQEQRLQREYVQEYSLITSDDRLEKIAQDIVTHFMGRGQQGKAMVVSIDKLTTVRMYDNVRKYWQRYSDSLKTQLGRTTDEVGRKRLAYEIGYMDTTDMAVGVSQEQNEVKQFRDKGLTILPHRQRMVREHLDEKFKDPDNPLRIVFVCAMWMTGFDVPSLSTIYLDKPMRNHTLMQTIARANRVFLDKANGLIVDYVGVFRDLQKALSIYGSGSGGGIEEGDTPVQDKSELLALLKQAVVETVMFCQEQGVDPQEIAAVKGLNRIPLLEAAENALVANDEIKKSYLLLARNVAKLYKAVLPHPAASAYTALVHIIATLDARIRLLTRKPDITAVMGDVEKLVGTSIATREYIIREAVTYDTSSQVDLSKIDFDALRTKFATGYKHTEVEKLRGDIESKLDSMIKRNKSRTNYQQKFQRLIDEYNAGSMNVDVLFERLVQFVTQELNVEEQRHIVEQLSEEELAIFDLLTQPDMVLSEKEKAEVKKVVRQLLETLKREKLVLDWRKKQQAQAAVKRTVRDMFYNALPPSYTRELCERAYTAVYQHIYDSYYGLGQSAYANAS